MCEKWNLFCTKLLHVVAKHYFTVLRGLSPCHYVLLYTLRCRAYLDGKEH